MSKYSTLRGKKGWWLTVPVRGIAALDKYEVGF